MVKYVRSEMRRTGEAATANRDILLGVKVYVGSNMNGRYSLDFLRTARELGDKFKLPLMAHISFAPPETPEVMDLISAGDVVTHCFNTHTLGIMDPAGKFKPGVKEARARGVLFDVGRGAGSFNFQVARRALDAGFLPDAIRALKPGGIIHFYEIVEESDFEKRMHELADAAVREGRVLKVLATRKVKSYSPTMSFYGLDLQLL